MDRSLALPLFMTPQRRARRRMRLPSRRERFGPVFEVLEDRVVPTAYTWNGGTDGNWATAANWTPSGVPGIADSATFPATLTAAQTIMLPANVTTSVLSINFAQTAAAAIVNITGGLGSSLQTSSITASASVSSVIGAPLIEGTTFLVDVEGSSPLFLNGAISGSAQFKKAGPGTLVLGGVNSFTGFVTVSAGVLSISADANLGSSSATTELILSPSNTVTGTAVLDVTANVTLGSLRRIEVGNFGGDGTIDFSNGSGMVVTNNNLVVSGPLTLLSDVPTATILLMNGTQSISSSVTLASGRILDSVSGAFSGSPVTVAAGGQIEFTKSMSSSTPFTFSGTGNDGRGALVIDGSSTTLTSITLGGDATADYVGPSIGMVTLPKVLGAFRLTLGGAPDSTAATWVFNSTVTANLLASNSPSLQTINMTAPTYGGVISGGGNVVFATVVSQITGAQTYSGSTTIPNGGSLTLSGGDNRLPTATALIFGAGNAAFSTTLTVGTTNQTLGSIVIPTAGVINGSFTGTGSITIAGNSDFQIGAPNSSTPSAVNLSMLNLTKFAFNEPSNALRVGYQSPSTLQTTSPQFIAGTLILAASNSITASLLAVGDQGGSTGGGVSSLQLGFNNTVDVDSINVGFGTQSGASFSYIFNATPTPTSVLRGTDGVSPVATWGIGNLSGGNTTHANWTATVNLSGGITDAKVGVLTVGSVQIGTSISGGSETGSFTLGATPANAPFTVNTLSIGTISGGGSTAPLSATGSFLMNGGVVSAGSILLASNTALPASSSNSVSGTFALSNGTLSAASISKGPQTGAGTAAAVFTWAGGTIQNATGSDLVVSGVPITIGSTGGAARIVNVSAGQTATFDSASPFIGFLGPSLTKAGSGTMVLNAANSFSGALNVSAGAVVLGNAKAIAGMSLIGLAAGTVLHMNGFSASAGLGINSFPDNGVVDNGGTTPSTLTFAGSPNGTIAGKFADGGPASLSLITSGQLVFTGNNTFSGGTTISSGSLRVLGSDASSSVSVGTSNLLGGSGTTPGTVAGIVVSSGNLEPGGGSILSTGMLDATNVTLSNLSTLIISIAALDASPVPGADYDQLDCSGTLSLGGAALTVHLAHGNLVPGAVYVIAQATSVVGTFGSLPDGSVIDAGDNQTLIVHYTSTAVTLTAAPAFYVSSTWATGFNPGDTLKDAVLTNGQSATFGVTAFATLADAVNAAGPGTSIYVNAGTYHEPIGNAPANAFVAIQIEGAVNFDSLAGDPTVSKQIDVLTGATLTVGGDGTSTTFASNIIGAGSFAKSGSGTLTLTGNESVTTTTIAQGILQIGSGGTSGSLSSGQIFDDGTLAFDSSGTQTFFGAIFGTGEVLADGTGTLEFGRTNFYTGPTVVESGTLSFSNNAVSTAPSNNGFETPSLTANTASFSPTGASWTFANGVSGVGKAGIANGTGGLGALTPPSGSQAGILENDGSVAQSLLLGTGNFVLNFAAAGPASGGTDPIVVLVDGVAVGTTVTPQAGAYARFAIPFTVATAGNHTIQIAGGNTNTALDLLSFVDSVTIQHVDLGAVEIDTAGTLSLSAANLTIASLTGNGLVIGFSNSSLSIGIDNDSCTFAGSIQTSVPIIKAGTGTLMLTGANTTTGTATVSAGALIVNGSLNVNSAVDVLVGATLGGTGSVGTIFSNGGGTVAPGSDAAAGTLTVSNFTLTSGVLFIDLPHVDSFDSVAVSGTTVNITGTTLSLSAGQLAGGGPYTILSVPGTNASNLIGTFANLPATNSSFTVGSQTFTINYAGGDGNDVTLTASGGAPPTIVSTILNGGIAYVDSSLAGNQHSMVENVVYTFSQAVNLTAANFTLNGFQGTPASLVPNVIVSGDTSGTVWTVTFSGVGVNAGTHSIGDGEYQLVLSGVPGLADNTFGFFRLLGDMDGNGTVNTSDFATLISTFLRATTDPLYLGADDFDGDQTIGTSDFAQFTANFLKSVPTPLPN